MGHRPKRRFYTPAESAEIWDRYQRGEGLKSIGRVFGKRSSSVFAHLQPYGGIRPKPRRRSRLALTLTEREEISRSLVNGLSMRRIASRLGRAPSTVCRELARNGGACSYRAVRADKHAWDRAKRPKACKLARHPALCREVTRLLLQNWSPDQIAGWLRRQYSGDESFWVSHETIYRSLFVQARGVLKKTLIEHLRTRRSIRRSKHATAKADTRGEIPDMVERQTRYLMLAKIAARDTSSVIEALIKQSRHLPEQLYKSLTWDRGKELTDHKRFTLATDIQVYFCDPQSPWQRGSNENTNRLLRQYFPRGTDLSVHSQARLNSVARQLNERPRKTLGYYSPAEKFNQCVASIG
jgi:IS30 family transposase